MSNIVQFPNRPVESDDEWVFTARIMRSSDGRAFLYLEEVCPVEFESDEQASQRMRRLGLIALEASANMMAIADGLKD